jgi:DNA-directed RNA polymerase subunit N (RpoN/RPB10)
VGDDVGKLWGKIVGRDDLVRGDIFGKVGVDRGGCGRKFLAHATLFLMVPKCQSTPLVVFIYITDNTLHIYHSMFNIASGIYVSHSLLIYIAITLFIICIVF